MSTRIFFPIRRAPILCLISVLTLAGCSSSKPPPTSTPPEVGVVTLHSKPVTITTDLPGRTVAYRIAEVRPQVSGIILKRLFTEGGEVTPGHSAYHHTPAHLQ